MEEKKWACYVHFSAPLFSAYIKSAVLYGCKTWNALATVKSYISRCLGIIPRIAHGSRLKKHAVRLRGDGAADCIFNNGAIAVGSARLKTQPFFRSAPTKDSCRISGRLPGVKSRL